MYWCFLFFFSNDQAETNECEGLNIGTNVSIEFRTKCITELQAIRFIIVDCWCYYYCIIIIITLLLLLLLLRNQLGPTNTVQQTQ